MSELDRATLDYACEPIELRYHAENPVTEDGRIHVTPELLFAIADRIDELRAELARRDEIIARLKEDAERLASISPFSGDTYLCRYCHLEQHSADCPVTLHRALMKELEND